MLPLVTYALYGPVTVILSTPPTFGVIPVCHCIVMLIVMDDDLRDMISSGASTDLLRKASRDKGFATLRDAGLAALYGGVTTLDEVVRETVLEDEA